MNRIEYFRNINQISSKNILINGSASGIVRVATELLIYVDYQTLVRTIKNTDYQYRKVIKRNNEK